MARSTDLIHEQVSEISTPQISLVPLPRETRESNTSIAPPLLPIYITDSLKNLKQLPRLLRCNPDAHELVFVNLKDSEDQGEPGDQAMSWSLGQVIKIPARIRTIRFHNCQLDSQIMCFILTRPLHLFQCYQSIMGHPQFWLRGNATTKPVDQTEIFHSRIQRYKFVHSSSFFEQANANIIIGNMFTDHEGGDTD